VSGFSDLVSAVETATGRPGRRSGRNVRLLCPAHDDHSPSLDVAEGADGSPLVTCRSCGAGLAEVCAALGREQGEFLGERSRTGPSEWTPHGPALAIYDYRDERGELLFQVCRTAAKQFPQRRPDAAAKHGWRWSLKGVSPVPYRLPELREAVAAGERVFVCEGEKDADAVRAAGGQATCNPGGAGKWRGSYARHLAGAYWVSIVADQDPAGLAHARQVERSLTALGPEAPLTVDVLLPAAGKDAADHLAAGHSLEDFLPFSEAAGEEREPVALSLDEFLRLDFQAPPPLLGTAEDAVIPAGAFCLLAGMPGSGKTTLACDLAFHLASGRDWLELAVPRPLRVLVVENEGPQHRFQRKLERKRAHWEHSLAGAIYVQTWRWGQFSFADPEHSEAVRAFCEQAEIDVVIGDPLDTLGTTGVGSPEETRDFLALLVPLGLTQTRTFVFLHHFRKEITPSEINMVSGSWGGRLDTLLVLRQTEAPSELRLSFPKVRWGTQHPERRPLILQKIASSFGFEVIASEAHEVSEDSGVGETLDRIITVLQDAGTAVERSVLALRTEATSERMFKRALRLGMEQGRLAKGSEGRRAIYSLSAEELWP